MKKLFSSIAFSMLLAAPMFGQAANVTTDLGTIQQGTRFGATHTDETFTDTYNLTIAPNTGVGSAAVNVHFAGSSETKFTSGNLVNVATNASIAYTIRNEAITNTIYADFGTLAAGVYKLVLGGVATGGTSSYDGNWTVTNASAVPVPAAVWLFGSALVGLMGVSGRKKKS